MDGGKFTCKQSEKEALGTGESANEENLKSEEKKIKGTQNTAEIVE